MSEKAVPRTMSEYRETDEFAEYKEAACTQNYGPCLRCGKPLVGMIPVLLILTRNNVTEQKQLCGDCFQAVFDSIKPLAQERVWQVALPDSVIMRLIPALQEAQVCKEARP